MTNSLLSRDMENRSGARSASTAVFIVVEAACFLGIIYFGLNLLKNPVKINPSSFTMPNDFVTESEVEKQSAKERTAWKIMQQLPAKLTRSTKYLNVVDEMGRGCPLCERNSGVIASALKDNIVVWNGGDWLNITNNKSYLYARRVLAHEAAHNMAWELWGSPNPPANSEYGQVQREEGLFYTDYARSTALSEVGKAEDFAEAVAEYCTDPNTLHKQSRKRFEVIWSLIGKCW